MNNFLAMTESRRSIYNLDKNLTISQDKIQEIVTHALKHTPSAFNSQSARVIILFDEKHDLLWDTTRDVLRDLTPEDSFATTEQKIKGFRKAAGTILYFDDVSVTKSLQENFPLYADNFPVWASQANGMLQYHIWVALGNAGAGASLQHYNPIIDDAIKPKFRVPDNWSLVAQMPFGNPVDFPKEKEFVPIHERLLILE
ncbi:MAG: nitroreductase family protein [Turicibacter sp.]|nr:nitroreductase family protein [Turicibacter sp.]